MFLKKVDFSNYKIAIKIQKEIFPKEDGTLNILASLDRNIFINVTGMQYLDDDVKYYLVYNKNIIVGITGLYCEKSICKESGWIGWFGIIKKYRGRGFGKKTIEKTIKLAQKQGYKTIRLYTDKEENKKAIYLYDKLGFISEKYDQENLNFDCFIYSKSLSKKTTELWNNKQLQLGYQTELDHMNEFKIKEILEKYENL